MNSYDGSNVTLLSAVLLQAKGGVELTYDEKPCGHARHDCPKEQAFLPAGSLVAFFSFRAAFPCL